MKTKILLISLGIILLLGVGVYAVVTIDKSLSIDKTLFEFSSSKGKSAEPIFSYKETNYGKIINVCVYVQGTDKKGEIVQNVINCGEATDVKKADILESKIIEVYLRDQQNKEAVIIKGEEISGGIALTSKLSDKPIGAIAG